MPSQYLEPLYQQYCQVPEQLLLPLGFDVRDKEAVPPLGQTAYSPAILFALAKRPGGALIITFKL